MSKIPQAANLPAREEWPPPILAFRKIRVLKRESSQGSYIEGWSLLHNIDLNVIPSVALKYLMESIDDDGESMGPIHR